MGCGARINKYKHGFCGYEMTLAEGGGGGTMAINMLKRRCEDKGV